LGGVSIEGPEGPLTGRIAHRPRLALLALLAAAGPKGVTREKLAGLLWPDRDEERARHQVSDSVYVIREALGADAVRTVGEVLHLHPQTVRSDVLAFESAIRAGELVQAVASRLWQMLPKRKGTTAKRPSGGRS
jgi:DNA-binding SARP family transcriptional activator